MDRTELANYLTSIPDQVEGKKGPSALGDGEASAYQEFFSMGLARPGDEVYVADVCATVLKMQLKQYLGARKGRLHWRKRLEWDINDYAVVVRHDPDGPDMDYWNDKRCFKDGNWKAVKAYCRLYREP